MLPSMSPCATNNIFGPKRKLLDWSTEGFRVMSDFRALKGMTRSIEYPTENVKAVVRWLASNRFYSVAHLKDGYWKCELRNGDRHLTAVRTVLGFYEYDVLAQVLKDASAFSTEWSMKLRGIALHTKNIC